MSFGIEGPPGRSPPKLTDQTTNKVTQSNKTTAHSKQAAGRADLRDRVSLTDRAAQLQALEMQISDLHVVDTHLVNEMQRTIALGNYQINPIDVVNKLLRFELGLSGN